MFERSHARDTTRSSTLTGYPARLNKRGFVTGTWLDLAASGMHVATPSMQVGGMPASVALPTTCRHQNLRRPWTSSFIWLKSDQPRSCAPRPYLGGAIAHGSAMRSWFEVFE